MKRMLWVVLCVTLTGCDYTVPLVKSPGTDMDRSVIGRWQRSEADGQTESLLVLPFNKREYMVCYPAGSDDAMFARASLWHGDGMTLVQLDWFGTARGSLPDDNRTFQFVAYAVDGERLTVRLLNPEVVDKDVASAEDLAQALDVNRDDPALFRSEMVFAKVHD